jgi:hypothetical protein
VRTLERRQTIGLGIAVAIVAVVASLVATLGVVPFPDVPTLADQRQPLPPGRIAYTTWDRQANCLHVVDGSGDDREVVCGATVSGDLMAWSDDGYVEIWRYAPGSHEVRVIDPATGAVVEIRDIPEDEADQERPVDDPWSTVATAPDGTQARVRSADGQVSVSVGSGDAAEVVWEASGPRRYSLQEVRWSPDGEWIAIRDSRDALLVMPADGSVAPRVWVEEIGWQWAWYVRDR